MKTFVLLLSLHLDHIAVIFLSPRDLRTEDITCLTEVQDPIVEESHPSLLKDVSLTGPLFHHSIDRAVEVVVA